VRPAQRRRKDQHDIREAVILYCVFSVLGYPAAPISLLCALSVGMVKLNKNRLPVIKDRSKEKVSGDEE
jgi:hypothetical protein